MPEEIVAITIVFICVGLPIISITLLKLARILKGEGSNSQKKSKRNPETADEIELIQELHKGLNRLEKRIDSLETIIIERKK